MSQATNYSGHPVYNHRQFCPTLSYINKTSFSTFPFCSIFPLPRKLISKPLSRQRWTDSPPRGLNAAEVP